MQALLIKLLKDYWPVAIIVALAWFVHGHGYDRGVADRDAVAVKEQLAASKEKRRELEQQAQDYLESLELYRTLAETAIDIEQAATKEAETNRKKAGDFYAKWQEAKKNATVEISCTDGAPAFTVGFVGMYNLSVKADYSSEKIELPDIANAAGVDIGAAGIDLSQPTKVTASDVLDVNAHNMKVARQCLSERKLFKDYLEKVNAARVQPPADL